MNYTTIEVCKDGGWQEICDGTFTPQDAKVICQHFSDIGNFKSACASDDENSHGMYVYRATAGATAGRLEQVVGDFNSTPNSPMVDFITSSFLNYFKMSATEIAGYDYRKGQSRVIPSPLLPPSMNIGPNCMYMESETDTTTTNATHSSNGIAKAAGGGTTKNDVLSKNERR